MFRSLRSWWKGTRKGSAPEAEVKGEVKEELTRESAIRLPPVNSNLTMVILAKPATGPFRTEAVKTYEAQGRLAPRPEMKDEEELHQWLVNFVMVNFPSMIDFQAFYEAIVERNGDGPPLVVALIYDDELLNPDMLLNYDQRMSDEVAAFLLTTEPHLVYRDDIRRMHRERHEATQRMRDTIDAAAQMMSQKFKDQTC